MGRTTSHSRTRRALVLLVALAGVLGCSTSKQPVSLAHQPRRYVPEDYRSVLETWTREKQLNSLKELDNVLTVTSTFQSWDFRHAYASRYGEDYGLTEQEQADFLRRSLHSSKEYHEFFVALYAQRPRWGDIDEEDPLWVVHLVSAEGNQSDPVAIDKVRKPSAMEQQYFPYVSTYRKVFRITFPTKTAEGKPTIPPDSDWFGLEFSGPQGKTTLKWALR